MPINKKIFRSAIVVSILAYAFLSVFFPSFSPEELEALLEKSLMVRVGLGAIGIFGGASFAYIWVSMLFHCYKNFKGSRTVKWGWLVALWFLNVLAAVIYYLIYIEFGRHGKASTD